MNDDYFIEMWREEHDGQNPPFQWQICDHCHGHGTSTSHLGAYTESDRAEMGDEWYDFMDDVHAGHYDQACPECKGTGKVREFTGDAFDEWRLWMIEEAADRHTMWAESGYPR